MKTIDETRRDNLLLAIERFGTIAALAETAGVSAAYLSQIKNKTPESKTGKPKGMGDKAARKIEDALCEAHGWMDVEHISTSDDMPKKIQSPGVFSESDLKSAHNTNGGPRERFDKNVRSAPSGMRRIPVISYVQAGMMTEAVDPFALGDGFETIDTDLEVSEQTFALIIEGTSMLPEFNEGDKVIIDPMEQPRPGDFVVAKNTQEEATFKKYRPRGTGDHGQMVFELVPLNDDFPTLNSERDHLRIIGVMVEHRKYRRR